MGQLLKRSVAARVLAHGVDVPEVITAMDRAGWRIDIQAAGQAYGVG